MSRKHVVMICADVAQVESVTTMILRSKFVGYPQKHFEGYRHILSGWTLLARVGGASLESKWLWLLCDSLS